MLELLGETSVFFLLPSLLGFQKSVFFLLAPLLGFRVHATQTVALGAPVCDFGCGGTIVSLSFSLPFTLRTGIGRIRRHADVLVVKWKEAAIVSEAVVGVSRGDNVVVAAR